jgi:hypothetical protein
LFFEQMHDDFGIGLRCKVVGAPQCAHEACRVLDDTVVNNSYPAMAVKMWMSVGASDSTMCCPTGVPHRDAGMIGEVEGSRDPPNILVASQSGVATPDHSPRVVAAVFQGPQRGTNGFRDVTRLADIPKNPTHAKDLSRIRKAAFSTRDVLSTRGSGTPAKPLANSWFAKAHRISIATMRDAGLAGEMHLGERLSVCRQTGLSSPCDRASRGIIRRVVRSIPTSSTRSSVRVQALLRVMSRISHSH